MRRRHLPCILVPTPEFSTPADWAQVHLLKFDNDYTEISVSVVSEIVLEELVIPLLLIPIYVAVFLSRRREFNRLLNEIEGAKTAKCCLNLKPR